MAQRKENTVSVGFGFKLRFNVIMPYSGKDCRPISKIQEPSASTPNKFESRNYGGIWYFVGNRFDHSHQTIWHAPHHQKVQPQMWWAGLGRVFDLHFSFSIQTIERASSTQYLDLCEFMSSLFQTIQHFQWGTICRSFRTHWNRGASRQLKSAQHVWGLGSVLLHPSSRICFFCWRHV